MATAAPPTSARVPGMASAVQTAYARASGVLPAAPLAPGMGRHNSGEMELMANGALQHPPMNVSAAPCRGGPAVTSHVVLNQSCQRSKSAENHRWQARGSSPESLLGWAGRELGLPRPNEGALRHPAAIVGTRQMPQLPLGTVVGGRGSTITVAPGPTLQPGTMRRHVSQPSAGAHGLQAHERRSLAQPCNPVVVTAPPLFGTLARGIPQAGEVLSGGLVRASAAASSSSTQLLLSYEASTPSTIVFANGGEGFERSALSPYEKIEALNEAELNKYKKMAAASGQAEDELFSPGVSTTLLQNLTVLPAAPGSQLGPGNRRQSGDEALTAAPSSRRSVSFPSSMGARAANSLLDLSVEYALTESDEIMQRHAQACVEEERLIEDERRVYADTVAWDARRKASQQEEPLSYRQSAPQEKAKPNTNFLRKHSGHSAVSAERERGESIGNGEEAAAQHYGSLEPSRGSALFEQGLLNNGNPELASTSSLFEDLRRAGSPSADVQSPEALNDAFLRFQGQSEANARTLDRVGSAVGDSPAKTSTSSPTRPRPKSARRPASAPRTNSGLTSASSTAAAYAAAAASFAVASPSAIVVSNVAAKGGGRGRGVRSNSRGVGSTLRGVRGSGYGQLPKQPPTV